MAQSEDLWPELGDAAIRTPITILREQALYLSKRTQGVVEGEVRTQTHGRIFVHNFGLVVPALQNYRYEVLICRHEISLYPAVVLMSYVQDVREVPEETCQNERQFLQVLKSTFAAPEVLQTVRALIAQASDPPEHSRAHAEGQPRDSPSRRARRQRRRRPPVLSRSAENMRAVQTVFGAGLSLLGSGFGRSETKRSTPAIKMDVSSDDM